MKNLSEITTLYVNPVPRTSAQGRHKQMFTIFEKTGEIKPTVNMHKNREFGVHSEYPFLLNTQSGKLQTGLDKPVDNIFKGLDISTIIEQYGLSQDWAKQLEIIVKQDQIKLQTKYEIFDNVSYNHYTNEVAGNSTIFNSISSANKEVKTPNYLQKFSVHLFDKPNRFTDETPRGRLSIALIKQHPRIAKSKAVLNSSIHDWYISEENEAVMEKMKRRDIIEEAMASLFNLKNDNTSFVTYKVATLLTNNENKVIVKGKVSDSRVKEALSDYIGDGQNQMENINKFLKIFKMLKAKDDRQKFDILYLVQQGVNTNVLTVRDGYLIWNSKSGTPNMYKHTDYDKFVNLILQEYLNYNEKENVTNWYKDLYEEVSSKGVWFEK
jgi:hypothetical protein